MSQDVVQGVVALPQQWPTIDPFLFCVHHDDTYPGGGDSMGPDARLLEGRDIGMDFSGRDGWSMYHGAVTPGFPRHPHRGFETVTLARRGYIDHSDSLGAAARFGQGDVQWMTAGSGIEHSEMFPLVNRDRSNPTELFQIWLNLPGEDKRDDAYFTMLWAEQIPRIALRDSGGRAVEVVIVAGGLEGVAPPAPPPSSWASRPDAGVAIWAVTLAPGARWVVPAGPLDATRVLYFFAGSEIEVGGQRVGRGHAVQVRPGVAVPLANGDEPGEILMLQGRPIGEPVAQHGPFVMNSREEIQQAFEDYRRGAFGRWPWATDDPVHPRESGRFARHASGETEHPPRTEVASG